MLSTTVIHREIADALTTASNANDTVSSLKSLRNSCRDNASREHLDAAIRSLTSRAAVENEYADALRVVAKRRKSLDCAPVAATVVPAPVKAVKPAPVADATIIRDVKAANAADAKVKPAKAERMTLSGRMMPTDKPASDAQIERLRNAGAKRIAKGISVADASDRLYRLKRGNKRA